MPPGKRAHREVFKVNQEEGDIFFFDTNCWHEGWKPCLNGEPECGSKRLVLEFEFMDTDWSNYALSASLGPCGAGQRLLAWHNQSMIQEEELLHLYKFDPSCIFQISGDTFLYSSKSRLSKFISTN